MRQAAKKRGKNIKYRNSKSVFWEVLDSKVEQTKIIRISIFLDVSHVLKVIYSFTCASVLFRFFRQSDWPIVLQVAFWLVDTTLGLQRLYGLSLEQINAQTFTTSQTKGLKVDCTSKILKIMVRIAVCKS